MEEIDSGDIIARDYLKITDNTKISEIWNWMKKTVPLLLMMHDKIDHNKDFILEKQSKDKTKFFVAIQGDQKMVKLTGNWGQLKS